MAETAAVLTEASTRTSLRKASDLASQLSRDRRFLSLADQALISISNMCTTVIIARVCAREQLGLYASGYSLVLLATAVQTALISVPYTISYPQLSTAVKRLYKGSTLLQQVGLSAIGILVFLCLGLSSARFSSHPGLGSIFLILSIVSGLICFRDFARRASYAELRFSFAVLIDGLAALIQVLAVAALAVTGHLTASRALGALGIAAGIASATWLIANWGSIDFSLTHSLQGFRNNWAFGRWLFSSSVLWSFSIEQYPWILTMLSSSSDAAIWASCYGVMAFLNPVVLALNNDAAPRIANDFAKGGLLGLRKSVVHAAIIGALITLPIILALLNFGGRLVTLMYGNKYSGAAVIVALLTIGLGFYATSLPFPYGMLTLRRPGIDFTINVICFLMFLTVGLGLVRKYGVLGAACSFAMVQGVALTSRILGLRFAVRSAARSVTGSHFDLSGSLHA